MLCAFVSEAQITNTFTSTNEGWTFFNGTFGSLTPGTFNASGGNPGGYISMSYSSNTSIAVQSWIAPSAYLGNHVVKSFGMNFSFDLQQSATGTNSNTNGDVRIENGGTAIVFSLPVKPAVAPAWSSYSLRLDETQGWRMNSTTGALATRAQITQVLSNITAIEIRGTYVTNATYTSGLDNVILQERTLLTPPAIASFSPKTGNVTTPITINGSGFDPVASNNAVYFGTVQAAITNASITQLTVAVPPGASCGPLTVINKTNGLQSKSHQFFTPTFDGGGRIIPSSFLPRVDISLSISIEGFTIGDLDGDGWVDLAVANNESDAIDIYRNLGLGGDLTASSFAARFTIAMTGSSTNGAGLRFADIDSDGKLDVISSTGTSAISSAFATFRNISTPGNLAFEAQENWAGVTDETPVYFIGDLDGDGRPEMIGGEGSGGAGANLWIIQNISSPGNIEFATSISFFAATVDALDAVSSGDLDNDGKPELLVTHAFGSSLSIIKNNSTPGTLSFTDIGQFSGGFSAVQAADLNADGKNDIVYKQGSDDIHIRLNMNDGISLLATTDFTTDIILASDLSNYGGLSLGDINGDGKVDIAATDNGNVGLFESIYTGGALTVNSYIPAYLFEGAGGSTYPTSPLAADLNGDGKPEIIMGVTNTTPNRIGIFQNNNVIAPTISINTISPLKAVIGSTVTITGDNFSIVPAENTVLFGTLKAVVISASKTSLTVEVPSGATYGYVSVTRNELTSRYHLPFAPVFSPGRTIGASSFGPAIDFTMPGADFDIDPGDMNNDGKVDILVEAGSRGHTFRNVHTTGAITTSSLVKSDTTSGSAQNPKLIDINGDGKFDVASVNGIYRNITSSTLIDFDPLVSVGQATNIGVGDFNRDGRLDWSGGATAPVQFYENRSRPGLFLTGTFATVSPAFTSPTGGTSVGTASADFDNDGYADIAAPVTSSIDYITFLRNTGLGKIANASFTTGQSINTLDLPGRVYEADLDVDGKMDFMIYYQAAGTNGNMFSIFHNNSTGPGNVAFVQHDYTIGAVTGTAGTIGGPSTIADLDGDGKPEIIITSASTNTARQGFYIYKNNSTPGTIDASSFTSSGLIPLATARAVAAADINADGKTDLIFTRTNLVTILENTLMGVPITVTAQPSNSTLCAGNPVVLGVTATGEAGLQYQWQQLVGATFTNISDNATYAGAASSTLTISNLGATATYRVRVTGSFAITYSANAVVTAVPTPAPPTANGTAGCTGTSVALTASGASDGEYRWYTTVSGGSPIAGAVNSTYNTPALTTTTSYFVAVNNGSCESSRAEAIATINTVSPPGVTSAARCGTGTVTLNASGGTDGNYRWYDVASGGTAISGAVNGAFTTPSLSANTTYHVALVSGSCESSRTPVTATINTTPAKPSVASSVTPISNVVTICTGSVTLSAPGGFTYLWSTGATTQQISVSTAGSFTVQVTDGNSCTSVSSDAIQVVIDANACNEPPVINAEALTTAIEGSVSLDLTTIISDPDNNIDLSSIIIVTQPQSGAKATIANGQLLLDYSGVSFSGTDVLTIRVCDLAGSCVTENLTIEVVGEIEVFNAISPNGDGLNEFLRLQYIEVLDRTRNNKVTILNRWGDIVFEISNYDNQNRVFKGLNNSGAELPSGTYFYKIEFSGQNAPAMKTGYLSLKR